MGVLSGELCACFQNIIAVMAGRVLGGNMRDFLCSLYISYIFVLFVVWLCLFECLVVVEALDLVGCYSRKLALVGFISTELVAMLFGRLIIH